MNWEEIPNPNTSTYLRRARVSFGWLVLATEDVIDTMYERRESGFEWRSSITYVFDPFKMWKIKTP